METIAKIQRKYCELQQEIKRMWEVENVNGVPLIISITEVIPKAYMKKLNNWKLKVHQLF